MLTQFLLSIHNLLHSEPQSTNMILVFSEGTCLITIIRSPQIHGRSTLVSWPPSTQLGGGAPGLVLGTLLLKQELELQF